MLPRTNDDYLKLIMATQSMTTWDQVTASFADTFTPIKLLQIGGDKMDVLGWTNPRNWMVATNCIANLSNSDRQNSASGYNHATTLNGPGTGLTDAGWILFSVGPAAFLGGMLWEWGSSFEAYSDLSAVSTVDRMSVLESKKIVYTMPEKILADAEIANKDFLDRGKVFNHLEQETAYASVEPDMLANLFSLFTGKVALSERKDFFWFLFDFLGSDYDLPESEVKDKERSWIEKIIVAMSLAAKRAWDFINNASFIYWLIFFSFASIVGMAAAASSPVFAPIIVGITLGLTALYVLPKLKSWIQNFRKSNEEIREEKKENEFMGKELRRMVIECQTRRFIKKEHTRDKQYLQSLNPGKLIDKKKRVYGNVPETTFKESKLGKYLLDGNKARFWLAIIIDAITAIVMTSFAFWIISAVTYVFAGAIALFTFFDSMFNSGIAGLLLGAFLAVRKYFDGTAAEQNAEKCMEEELRKDYKGTGKTKLAVFESLENELEFEKAKAEWQRLKLLLKDVSNDVAFKFTKSTMYKFKEFDEYHSSIPTDTFKKNYEEIRDLRIEVEKEYHRQNRPLNMEIEDALAREYDLDKIDVYNHQIFEKQQYQPTAWERVKQIGACAYTFLAGGQTGTLLARSLFLAGCVFGGIVASATGSLPIFLGIAITFAVLYGVARVAQFVLEDDRQKKENMYKNIDVRISYLEKKKEVVKTLNNTLKENITNLDLKSLWKVNDKQMQETPCEWIEKRCREAENYYKTMMKTTFFGNRSSFDNKAKVVNASDINYVPLDSDSENQKLSQSIGSSSSGDEEDDLYLEKNGSARYQQQRICY